MQDAVDEERRRAGDAGRAGAAIVACDALGVHAGGDLAAHARAWLGRARAAAERSGEERLRRMRELYRAGFRRCVRSSAAEGEQARGAASQQETIERSSELRAS